jgi:tetratricopeptide (TPR) repeat protein
MAVSASYLDRHAEPELHTRVRRWRDEVAAARSTCALFKEGKVRSHQLARVAPTLVDSLYSDECAEVLDSLDPADINNHPRLAMAKGRLLVLRGDPVGASAHLSKAMGRADRDAPLVARAVWELGCLSLGESNLSTADAALRVGITALGEAASRSPDLLHLEALLAERRSERELAIGKYREAIAESNRALTLLTRVAAMRNLAGALAHDKPRDAAGLCALGLALIDGDLLDERSRPALENVLAYTLLADGDVEDGKRRAEAAALDARRLGHFAIECYALFNQAIALELLGRSRDAEAMLIAALRISSQRNISEIGGWIQLRLLWLELKSAVRAGENHRERALSAIAADIHAASVRTYRAIEAYHSGEPLRAIEELQPLVNHYVALSDWSTSFALLLWLACAHAEMGERATASAAVQAALRIGRSHGLRLSPNWWSDDLVRTARELASPEDAEYAAGLLGETGTVRETITTRVAVSGDGNILIDDQELPEQRWRMGKTGKRVLRRLFRCLAAAHPIGIERDELADLLWPDSDGDRALQNLYAALNDLRHLLQSVPGLSIATEDGRYRLSAPSTVLFERASEPRQLLQGPSLEISSET